MTTWVIEEGKIWIRDRPGTPFLQMLIRIDDGAGHKRRRGKSSKTTDIDDAKLQAIQWCARLEGRVEAGARLDGQNLGFVGKAYLDDLKTEVRLGNRGANAFRDYQPVVQRYFIDGPLGNRQIDLITEKDIKDYQRWRDTYWTDGPGLSGPQMRVSRNGEKVTVPAIVYERGGRKLKRPAKAEKPSTAKLRIENMVMRQVFEFARISGWTTLDRIPNIANRKHVGNKRPPFSRDQMARFIIESINHASRGSRRHSSAMLSSPRRPSKTMRIFSSAENRRRVARRMSLTTFSARSFVTPDFCLIFAP